MKRRTVITGLAALVPALGSRGLLAKDDERCSLITQDLRGPFDIPDYLVRSDLRDGQPGMPLTLDFTIVGVLDCTPVEGAAVTVWHSNPEGLYSAVTNILLDAQMNPTGEVVDQRELSYCRGVQRSDAEGRVRFVTNFPGWYYPRPPHIHVKVTPPGFGEEAVTQLYLPVAACDAVYATEHYVHRGPNPIRVDPGDPDPITATEALDLWLEPQREDGGYRVSHELAIAAYGDQFGDLPDMYRHS